MARVTRGRVIGYKDNGAPIIGELQDLICLSTIPEVTGSRVIGYKPGTDEPLVTTPWACCDYVCTDYEIENGLCWVQEDCYPLGPGPGIARKIGLYAFDEANCHSAYGVKTELIYDDITSKWLGSIELRGGVLAFQFSCVPGLDPLAPNKFFLEWSGCDSGSLVSGVTCPDPMVVPFGNIILEHCCACRITGSPATDEAPQVTFFVVGNCRRLFWGRVVDYTDDGYPVIASDKPCAWYPVYKPSCSTRTCPLHASIRNVSDCSCLDMVELGIPYNSGKWEYVGIVGCGGQIGTIRLTCANTTNDPVTDKPRVSLQCDFICGVTNIGTSTIIINAEDLDFPDFTFTLTLTDPMDPPSCCNGQITIRFTSA